MLSTLVPSRSCIPRTRSLLDCNTHKHKHKATLTCTQRNCHRLPYRSIKASLNSTTTLVNDRRCPKLRGAHCATILGYYKQGEVNGLLWPTYSSAFIETVALLRGQAVPLRSRLLYVSLRSPMQYLAVYLLLSHRKNPNRSGIQVYDQGNRL